MASRPVTPFSMTDDDPDLPEINENDSFAVVMRNLSEFFVEAFETRYSFDELRTTGHGRILAPLVNYLAEEVHHCAIVHALLALKGHFSALALDDDRGVMSTRGFACEIVAWRFVAMLAEREAIDALLFEIPSGSNDRNRTPDTEASLHTRPTDLNTRQQSSLSEWDKFAASFANLNALEIGVVTGAKKFMSQRVIQKVINEIWRGDIIFWETLSFNSVKKAKIYNKRRADPFCRLRVPRYLKAFEVLFFACFLSLYYIVLLEEAFWSITISEILLYIFLAGFAYDEFGGYIDAGQAFYAIDFWSVWDLGIVFVGVAFFVTRMIGLYQHSHSLTDTSFDILALEALFLFPRLCSLLSLHPYFGTLLPTLNEMAKDFVRFIALVIIPYLGFLTTFAMLARGRYTVGEMSWLLVQIFFGSAFVGFVSEKLSPYFGAPVMVIFVFLTNILLITSLISLMSSSAAKILQDSRVEYLYGFSVFVLEASTSNRLIYYLPPLNLIALFFRPLRLVFSRDKLRSARIVMMKITHFPFVAAIWLFENTAEYIALKRTGSTPWISPIAGPESPSTRRRSLKATRNSPHSTTLTTPSQTTLAGGWPNARTRTVNGRWNGSNRNHPTADDADPEYLRSLVVELSTRVNELTKMLAEQQGEQDTRSDEE
ncbi:hypothetical protein M501DRAFT_1011617 [Patellaria atrata CBS 101060]|uniref:Calcium channel YVC1-like C-terminal transmembrane domain-containing protein n=1 Tax=Patellaria atrata CBS 101060 TaxID=1346257 RepID=A0A9P4VST6_9PEZI|nr:hypothetical protein M501DRAFT_1011617 [Patellaria atrata CBS 101060]